MFSTVKCKQEPQIHACELIKSQTSITSKISPVRCMLRKSIQLKLQPEKCQSHEEWSPVSIVAIHQILVMSLVRSLLRYCSNVRGCQMTISGESVRLNVQVSAGNDC